jgi:putative ABC transport system permease protein
VRLRNRVFTTFEGVGIALDAIRSNKVRAALTIMGVAVGVFVVVAMGATIHGITASFQADVSEMGAETFMVRRRGIGINSCEGSDDQCPERRNPPITLREWEVVKDLPSVHAAVPTYFGGVSLRYHDRLLSGVNYEAYGPEWMETDGGDIAPGRNFTVQEYEAGANVVILNDTASKQLFAGSDPIGKTVQLDSRQFTVIGVYQSTAGFLKSLDGRGPDRPKVILPLESARRHLGANIRGILLTVKPRADVTRDDAMDEVTAALRTSRGLRPSQRNNFALVGQDRLMEVFNQLFGAIFLVGLALSGVALLVGGVGVVAIMMISVTERTREIGVRKALGATRATILWQFLVEAATLTSIGAAVGLALGAAIAFIIRNATMIPASVPPAAVISALMASALTGIAFGMAPAARAARLDPVEALRHE